jgi:CDP-paratose 2-epimerase
MKTILVTGSGGLIGSEAVRYFLSKNNIVHGIEPNMRKVFFGPAGDVSKVITELNKNKQYTNHNVDVRDRKGIEKLFKKIAPDIIIHCAAQPSHDKAASIPFDDFDTNAVGTLNLLEYTRQYCDKNAIFIHMSTNKVYGDGPNNLKLKELDKRYDFSDKKFIDGINESFSIDRCLHSLFGASKVAADVLVQEYGKYFEMNTAAFRGGCLTGPQHAGVALHGFLSYIVKCAVSGKDYTVFGYKGKQVRDQIHSYDVITAFDNFIADPRQGEVYNIGGQKINSASVLEVIDIITELSGKQLNYSLSKQNRIGDHICYYSDMTKFKKHYPNWTPQYSIKDIIQEIIDNN